MAEGCTSPSGDKDGLYQQPAHVSFNAMTRYIALLRAINVGGHVVKMDALRRTFEEMGLTRISTFIASGNVLFESSARNTKTLEQRIEAHLRASLGYEVATFLRTAAEITAIAAYKPFADAAMPAALYIGFMADPLSDAAQAKLLSFRSAVDDFHTHGREVYWLCRVRSSDSEFSLAKFEKALGVRATFRNVTTVRKIAELVK